MLRCILHANPNLLGNLAGIFHAFLIIGNSDNSDRHRATLCNLQGGIGSGFTVARAIHRHDHPLALTQGTARHHQHIAVTMTDHLLGAATQQAAHHVALVPTAHHDNIHRALLCLIHNLGPGIIAMAQQDLAAQSGRLRTCTYLHQSFNRLTLFLGMQGFAQCVAIIRGRQHGEGKQLGLATAGHINGLTNGTLGVFRAIRNQHDALQTTDR